ncbi:DUF3653 domain-containing protein [Lysobacter sp. Hz 25]|uniref:DUF3653 domain-containing protein n=1 Tax=Lysobacter sp. Hz 25 TaxID=3383698 RepID=UPI0038D443A4
MTRPPCWPDNSPCPNDCAAALLHREAYNHLDLTGPWAGWRLRGRDLITPDGERFSPERLRGLAWRQDFEQRRDAASSRNAARKSTRQLVKVVVVDLGEYRVNGLAVG